MALFGRQLTRQSAVLRSTANPSGVVVATETTDEGFPAGAGSTSGDSIGEPGDGETSARVSRARLDLSACLRASKTTLNIFSQGRSPSAPTGNRGVTVSECGERNFRGPVSRVNRIVGVAFVEIDAPVEKRGGRALAFIRPLHAKSGEKTGHFGAVLHAEKAFLETRHFHARCRGDLAKIVWVVRVPAGVREMIGVAIAAFDRERKDPVWIERLRDARGEFAQIAEVNESVARNGEIEALFILLKPRTDLGHLEPIVERASARKFNHFR